MKNKDMSEKEFETLYQKYIDKAREKLSLDPIDEEMRAAHYTQMDIEPIDFARSCLTREQLSGAYLFMVIKYASRFNTISKGKGGLQDLLKCQDYLNWLIELEEQF